MPKPALTAHQTELRAKLHNRCDAVKRQNQTRNILKSGFGWYSLEVETADVPIDCRSVGHGFRVTHIKSIRINSDESPVEPVELN